MDFVGCLIELADTPSEDFHLVDLSVVAAGLLLIEVAVEPFGLQIAGYAESIRAMCLLKAETDAAMLCDIAIRMLDLKFLVSCLQPLKDSPSHDVHEGFCPERLAALCLELNLATMQRFMAGFAQGNEIVGVVTTCVSALNVMDLEYLIPAFAMAVLTRVPVTAEYVFTRVPGAELLSLLILNTRDLGILDELDVKGSRFDDDPCDWQEFQHILNAGDMCGNDVFERGRKPALVLAVYTVVETWRAIACLAIAP